MTDQEHETPSPEKRNEAARASPLSRLPFPAVAPELRLRIASGAVVAAVAIAALYWGAVPFAILLAVIATAMAWEWGRIVRGKDADVITVLHIGASVLAVALAAFDMAGLGIAVAVAGAITAAALAVGLERPSLTALGVLYTSLPVVALEWLRSDGALGFLAVLFIMLAVAATDTAAYFSGRSIGGPKLWPAVSPNKTWSGLIGGVSAAALVGLVFPYLTGTGSSAWLAALGLILGLIAQGGDLAESALKRTFNMKDASNLIPGHGGVMDRMDGLVASAIASGILAFIIEAGVPARALLYGE